MIKEQNKWLLNLVEMAVINLNGKHQQDNGLRKFKFGLEAWLMQLGFQPMQEFLRRNSEEKVEVFI